MAAASVSIVDARAKFFKTFFKLWTVFYLWLVLIQLTAVSCNILYSDNDHILLLNETTFASTIFEKDRAFIIEFYNSWCGHCIRYAPTWKAFAKDIKDWNRVVAPVAVDCAVNENRQICQDYNIPAFPTIKLFWTHVTAQDLGVVTDHKDEVTVRHNLIDFLTKKAEESGAPEAWPSLQPVRSQNLEHFWSNIPTSVESMLLILETEDSYIGREVILDFSGTKARIVRMLDTQSSMLTEPIEKLPALLLLRRNSKPETLWTGKTRPREELQAAIEIAADVTLPREPDTVLSDMKEKPGSSKVSSDWPVRMVDLETTLYYILTQEVALKKELSGESLSAFKAFLYVLTKSFPGRVPVMRYLYNLYEWVSRQDRVIQMDQLQETITDSQSEGLFLPVSNEWIRCKGSHPKYRGYPCGLWTLFHSMTVQSYRQYLAGEITYPQEVLFAIRNYILQFFSCTDCAQHFQSMSGAMKAQTQHPNDTVLWLWNAHNQVNHRLRGDETEDPQFPKVPFPPMELCSKCRKISNQVGRQSTWDLHEVIYFLTTAYGRSRISLEGVVEFQAHTTIPPNLVFTERKFQNNKGYVWNFRYFSGLDVSLCVLLYVFSMVLLVLVFVVFRLRLRKLKKKVYVLP